MLIGYLAFAFFVVAAIIIVAGGILFYSISDFRSIGMRLYMGGAQLMKVSAGLFIGVAISVVVFSRFELGVIPRAFADALASALGLMAMWLPYGSHAIRSTPKEDQ